jgi:hypothetical protein
VSDQRYWTVDEARAALPRMRELLAILSRAADLATRVRSNGHASIGKDEASETGSLQESGERFTGEVVTAGDIQPVLEELERSGIVLRDPTRGLIDFPAMHLGRPVHLCWLLGEDELEWWHLPDDGFAGRRRLPLPEHW